MIKNRNLAFGSTDRTNLFLHLPNVATASLPSASASNNEGGIVYDTTTSTVKFSDGSSWADLTAAGTATHSLLSATHSDSTAAAVARGALITGQGVSPAWVKLTIGTTGYVPLSDGVDIAWGQISDAGVHATAGITVSKIALTSGALMLGASSVGSALAVGTAAQVLLCNATPTPTWTTLGGDVTVGATGTMAIASGVIVNDDINATAGITLGKVALTTGSIIIGAASVGAALDVKGDGKIIVGNATTATSVAVTGDVALTNLGVTTVTDLTISGEAAGDILYRNATNWVRLAKPGSSGYFLQGGTTPAWTIPSLASASSIQTGATLLDAGVLDATITFTEQTVGGASVVIPNFAGATAAVVDFTNFAQTFSAAKSFNTGCIKIGDSNNSHYLGIVWNADMAANQTLNIVTGAADRTITLGGAITTTGDLITVGDDSITLTTGGATNVTLPTTGTLAIVNGALGNCTVTTVNKLTLTQPANGSTITITDAKVLAVTNTLTLSGTDGTIMTFPAVSDTVAGLATAQVFTADQTINYGHLFLRDNDEAQTLQILVNENMTGNKTLTIQPNDGSRVINLTGNLTLAGNLTTTGAFNTSFTQAASTTLALPGANTTLVGHDTTNTLTNKTLDCAGTGNVITNVGFSEVDVIATSTDAAPTPDPGIPFKLVYDVTQAATTAIYTNNAPYKFEVLDAYIIGRAANAGGTVLVDNGTNTIVGAMTLGADNIIVRAASIDDAFQQIAANGSLRIISSSGTEDFRIVITIIKVS